MTLKSHVVLIRGIEVVVFLFAAFSGFLKIIAPPEEVNTSFALGMTSFLTLITLLFITAISQHMAVKQYKRLWLIVAFAASLIFLSSGVLYKYERDRLTFFYPPESSQLEYVGGTSMTQEARTYKDKTGKSDASVVAAFGGLLYREQVWPGESSRTARLILTVNYMLLVLTLAATLFSLVEGIIGRRSTKSGLLAKGHKR
jgi:hypothetical protein